MKIIQEGSAPWPREITAACCKAKLAIDPQDIKTDEDYPDPAVYYIDCPSCGGQPTIAPTVKTEADRWLRQQRWQGPRETGPHEAAPPS